MPCSPASQSPHDTQSWQVPPPHWWLGAQSFEELQLVRHFSVPESQPYGAQSLTTATHWPAWQVLAVSIPPMHI